MDRGTWQVTVRGVTKNETRLNDRAHMWGLKLLQVISSSLTRDYLVPWSGAELRPPALGVQRLNHWATREAPYNKKNFFSLWWESLLRSLLAFLPVSVLCFGFLAEWHVGSYLSDRDRTFTHSIGRPSLNHQIAREVLSGSNLECVWETIVNCVYDSSSFLKFFDEAPLIYNVVYMYGFSLLTHFLFFNINITRLKSD